MISVFALLGQYFFAAQFVFDDDDRHVEECSCVGCWETDACRERCPDIETPGINQCVRRLNFDTFWW